MRTAHDLVAEAKTQITELDIAAAEQAIQRVDLLLDVREPDEYQAGHIPGARHIPRGLLEFRMESTPELSDRELSIVLYCKTSGRAALAARSLHDMGYLNVSSIAGGFDAWVAAGKPQAGPSLPNFD